MSGAPSHSAMVRPGSSVTSSNNNKPVSFQRSIEQQNAPSLSNADNRVNKSSLQYVKEAGNAPAKPASIGGVTHVDNK
ncbi:hypothetical protein HanRHA438_Chr11g0524201 [Helianthus annuus]|nr:hypothetical protein HanRHA438_Chr11g0524201 [Helianthus annuus]